MTPNASLLVCALTVAVIGCESREPLCGSDGVVAGPLTIDETRDLEALAGCTEIDGDVVITAVPPRYFLYEQPIGVTSLVGLESLERIRGTIMIANSSLTDLRGLEGIIEIDGALIIGGNQLLVTLADLSSLQTIGRSSCAAGLPPTVISYSPCTDGLRIDANGALSDVEGLAGVQHVGGDVVIANNGSLGNLEGLRSLSTVDGLLLLIGANIRDVTGLRSLSAVDDLTVFGTGLTSLAGLEALATVGDLAILNNQALQSLQPLSGLSSAGSLAIQGNAFLENLAGLDGLTRVDGDVWIGAVWSPSLDDANERLSSLSGLEALASIAGTLSIHNQPSLRDISALGTLASVGGLAVSANPSLRQCQVDLLAERLGVVCECSNNGDEPCP